LSSHWERRLARTLLEALRVLVIVTYVCFDVGNLPASLPTEVTDGQKSFNLLNSSTGKRPK
jgi:hypothetical protein